MTKPPARHIFHLEPRTSCAIAACIGVAGYFIGLKLSAPPTAVIAAWDSFAISLLALLWVVILNCGVDHIRYRARTQDLSRTLVFTFTILAACSSVFAVIALLSAAKKSSHLGLHAAVSGLAVIGSWSLVHTMFAMRYAHNYYGEGTSPNAHVGGLEFPSDKHPTYLDFAYFSFVIGMTAQVSDVQIRSKSLRSLALVHGILSFCFNTIILALTINTISGLL